MKVTKVYKEGVVRETTTPEEWIKKGYVVLEPQEEPKVKTKSKK